MSLDCVQGALPVGILRGKYLADWADAYVKV